MSSSQIGGKQDVAVVHFSLFVCIMRRDKKETRTDPEKNMSRENERKCCCLIVCIPAYREEL